MSDTTSTDDERARFEATMLPDMQDKEFLRSPTYIYQKGSGGTYFFDNVESAWLAWQARAKIAADHLVGANKMVAPAADAAESKDAAMSSEPKFTPGPWQWVNRDSGSVMLQTPDRGRLVVMAFRRKGMQSAEPRFAVMDDDQPRGRRGGILMSMSELMDRGKNELPADAALIAAAPMLYEALAALTDWHEWSLEQSERAADEFYRETGMLAPFKDASADSYVSAEHSAERRQAWTDWYAKRNATLISAARTALASARGEG